MTTFSAIIPAHDRTGLVTVQGERTLLNDALSEGKQ